MDFRTKVDIGKTDVMMGHDDDFLLLGSCFSDNIGDKLSCGGFRVTVNPLGTLYNPASIASAVSELLKSKKERNPVFFDWLHSKADRNAVLTRNYDYVIVTFGTSWIYRLKENNMIVANCRKQPDSLFRRERLSKDEIVDTWSTIINDWQAENDRTNFVFTVSPIRHKKDGFHENQLSKATLLLAVDELISTFPDRCIYFPAYEIMMDELRDYRFYAEDMIHPSSVAVDYIWERFQDTFFSPQTRQKNIESEKQKKRENHIPINQ